MDPDSQDSSPPELPARPSRKINLNVIVLYSI